MLLSSEDRKNLRIGYGRWQSLDITSRTCLRNHLRIVVFFGWPLFSRSRGWVMIVSIRMSF